jgi:hypothetical protein
MTYKELMEICKKHPNPFGSNKNKENKTITENQTKNSDKKS